MLGSEGHLAPSLPPSSPPQILSSQGEGERGPCLPPPVQEEAVGARPEQTGQSVLEGGGILFPGSVLGAAQALPKAISSLLKRSFPAWELIAADASQGRWPQG